MKNEYNHIYKRSILLIILCQKISKPRKNWNKVHIYFVLFPILNGILPIYQYWDVYCWYMYLQITFIGIKNNLFIFLLCFRKIIFYFYYCCSFTAVLIFPLPSPAPPTPMERFSLCLFFHILRWLICDMIFVFFYLFPAFPLTFLIFQLLNFGFKILN